MLLEESLCKLDRAVDPEHVVAVEDLHRRTFAFEEVERLPTIVQFAAPDWPSFPYRESFDDPEKMLINELSGVWVGALCRDDRVFTIRANYGVGILPSLFGCKIRLIEDQMPWVEHLGQDDLERILSAGMPDLTRGLGGKVLDTERYYQEALSRFDNLAQTVHIYVCDVQGPFDVAHLIMGHRIYTDVIDNPDLVHAVLDLVTDVFIAFARLQREVIGEPDGASYHSNHLLPGAVRVCEDSPTNLSADMYREFCKPYNERVFAALGGGWVHFCGSGKQMLPALFETPGLTGLNFGNPERHEPDTLFAKAREARVVIIGWPREIPTGVKTGASLVRFADDLDKARAMAAE